jgi:hypothetical protein
MAIPCGAMSPTGVGTGVLKVDGKETATQKMEGTLTDEAKSSCCAVISLKTAGSTSSVREIEDETGPVMQYI